MSVSVYTIVPLQRKVWLTRTILMYVLCGLKFTLFWCTCIYSREARVLCDYCTCNETKKI